jgi:hypothetical protein
MAYNKFVKLISTYSSNIIMHSDLSWHGIDMTKHEPQIIEQYLMGNNVGVDYLNKNLVPILLGTGYEVKFASVFIHGKPIVTRTTSSVSICNGNTPSCELGDLLIVFCFLDATKKPIYCSAMLSQAKKTAVLTSASQQCLYDSDKDFEMPARIYTHSIIPNPARELPGYANGRTKALTYTILEPRVATYHVPWTSSINHTWGLTIQRILNGDLGLEFKGPVVNPDWNCIIHDLVSIGTGNIPSSKLRGNALADVTDIFNDFNEYEKYTEIIENGPGVPMMFMIIRDKEYTLENKN